MSSIRDPTQRWWLTTLHSMLVAGLLVGGIGLAFKRSVHAVGPEPLVPAAAGGVAELDRALARLSQNRRLLMIAAHPDDEDTTLLAYVARGLGGEAAYLSLSRGDGGQNLIGPELGVGLGLIRSQELLSARAIDGARQYFARAFDFGFTRSLEETLQRWPREVLLEDAVRIVRRFKPQVLVSVFPASPAAGHGQHQAAGWVADRLQEQAADPRAFPQLQEEGLEPWTIESFYQGAWWRPEAEAATFPLGEMEPAWGRSMLQVALASRSQHRSQDMGRVQVLGRRNGRVIQVTGPTGGERELFGGIDTSLESMARLLPAGARREAALASLRNVAQQAELARERLTPRDMQAAVAPLGKIVHELLRLRALAVGAGPDSVSVNRHFSALIDEKLRIAWEALASAGRVVADAYATRETVVPGQRLEVSTTLWNAGAGDLSELGVRMESPAGWQEVEREPAPPPRGRFAAEVDESLRIQVDVPLDARSSRPYFLRRSMEGDLFDWADASPEERGEPFGSPAVVAHFTFRLDGVPVELHREVVYRYGDQAVGEVRRPLRSVPALELSVEPEQVVWPLGSTEPVRLQVELSSHLPQAARGRLSIEGLPDWPGSESREIEVAAGGRQRMELLLQPPSGVAAGQHTVRFLATLEDGRQFSESVPLIDYEHIRPTPIPVPAQARISTVDLRLPSLRRLGYVRGASDRVPEMLLALGLPLELLSGEALATADLSRFDAMVIGSRAYETDPALGKANSRLLDYVREGGLLLVQYQQYQFVAGDYAPYELVIRRPHDRITDEHAAVRLLQPTHPALNQPNRLGPADWQGWVQERGLYFAGTWDSAYEPLLAMSDPQGEEKQGALLVASLGQGTYIYTGLAFFRQLPAGVPGAYRLLANLLALAETDAEEQSP